MPQRATGYIEQSNDSMQPEGSVEMPALASNVGSWERPVVGSALFEISGLQAQECWATSHHLHQYFQYRTTCNAVNLHLSAIAHGKSTGGQYDSMYVCMYVFMYVQLILLPYP